jgi:hypothetical protein
MSTSYEIAGWVGLGAFVLCWVAAVFLRWNPKYQETRIKLLLLLIVYGTLAPILGFMALPGLGGTTVVNGRTVTWVRFTVNAVVLSFFAAFFSHCIDPSPQKAVIMFFWGLANSLWLVFASLSANDGVWYFWIFSVVAWVITSIYVIWWLQTPPAFQHAVSFWKGVVCKFLFILGYAVFIFVGYLIDTPWLNGAGGDLSLLQWLNVGWDIIFFGIFGLFLIWFVDLYEVMLTPELVQEAQQALMSNTQPTGTGGYPPPQSTKSHMGSTILSTANIEAQLTMG